jgi:hypothetical protein
VTLAALAAVALIACGGEAPEPGTAPRADGAAGAAPAEAGADGELAELRAVWQRVAANPATAAAEDREVLGALVQEYVLPALQGAQWQVRYVGESQVADLLAELVPEGAGAPSVSIEIRWRTDAAELLGRYGDRHLGGHSVSTRGKHYFVLAGSVELRATGRAAPHDTALKLENLFRRFPLERIASL